MKNLLVVSLLLSYFITVSQEPSGENSSFYLSKIAVASLQSKEIYKNPIQGILAYQYYNFYQEALSGNQTAFALTYPMIYSGYLDLMADKQLVSNPLLGLQNARLKADSIFNQYHGHLPYEGVKQVAVRSIHLSSDGQKMFSAGGDGRLLSWDVNTRSYKELYKSNKTDRVVDISSDGRWLALATNRDEVDLFDMSLTELKPQRLKSHKGAIYDLAFLPDGSGFISIGSDQEIQKTDIKTGKGTFIKTSTSKIQSLAISPDATVLATGSARGEIFMFNLKEPNSSFTQWAIIRKRQEEKPVKDLRFSSSGRFLAIGGFDFNNGYGYVTLWDMVDKNQVGLDLGGFTSPVTEVKFSQDEKYIAAASNDRTVRIWRMDRLNELPLVLDDARDWIWSIEFDPNGNFIMTASADGLIRKYPLTMDEMANEFCNLLDRNLTEKEWNFFIGSEIPWQETCPGKPQPKAEE